MNLDATTTHGELLIGMDAVFKPKLYELFRRRHVRTYPG